MTDIICPICGKPNPPDQEECLYCQAPLKSTGFFFPSENEGEEGQQFPAPEDQGEAESQFTFPDSTSSLEDAIPDWLKETEAGFLEPSEPDAPPSEAEDFESPQISEQIDALLSQPATTPDEKQPAIDDDWLASLLEEAGLGESSETAPPHEIPEEQGENVDEEMLEAASEGSVEEQPSPLAPAEKPDWLTELEASSTIKLEGGVPPADIAENAPQESEPEEQQEPEEQKIPDWVGKPSSEEAPPTSKEEEAPIAPAELPSWLEALRPTEATSPTEPVEDVSAADVVTAGPLAGLRGVISAHPSAIKARKPPTYSIKLRVTDEQQARMEMMEELLVNEQKPTPLPSTPIITSRNITRIAIAVILILPIIWMIITNSQNVSSPQPGNVQGVAEFTQQIQRLPSGAPVLVAFDYEAGFSGEMDLAISTLISQLMVKNAYLTLVTTTPSGPALAESMIDSSASVMGRGKAYTYYTDLGYIPGGTLGLLGLATSPKVILPYSLDGSNVWAAAPLNVITTIKDFSAVIVLTNDSATARSWIEQVGPYIRQSATPLLIITSTQAEPLILPYYLAVPSQVQGLITGIVGGMAYARMVGNIQQNSLRDALSVGVIVSVLIILVGMVIGLILKVRPPADNKEN